MCGTHTVVMICDEWVFRKEIMQKVQKEIEAINFAVQVLQEKKGLLQTELSEILTKMPLDSLGLTGRALTPLKKNGVTTLGQLVSMSADELLRSKVVGHTNLRHINDALKVLGLSLRG